MGDLRLVRAPFGPVPSGGLAASTAAIVRTSITEPNHVRLAPTNLKILHLFRAPVGGIFRHVVDLAQAQIERGHHVGLILDSTTGDARANAVLANLAPRLKLGLERLAITREPSLQDIPALRRISQRIRLAAPDVLHGHGAKGAAFARLAPSAPNAIRVYTPHGGSLHYFRHGTLTSGFYRTLEWLLNSRTDLLLFESTFAADQFRSHIGPSRALVRIVRNGLGETEFDIVTARSDATDIVCVGELSSVKAIDVLIEAIAALKRSGRQVSATIVGEGPERAKLEALTERLDVAAHVRFVGYRPARKAFAMGRVLEFRRAPTPCPMWCSRRWRRRFLLSPPMSAAFRKSSADMPAISLRRTMSKRLAAQSWPRSTIRHKANTSCRQLGSGCAPNFP